MISPSLLSPVKALRCTGLKPPTITDNSGVYTVNLFVGRLVTLILIYF